MAEPAGHPRRSDVNREHLVNAAAALFWSRGYKGTSLADIAGQSGVPLGNIYYYFRTKAAIAEAVGVLLRDQTRDALDQIDSEGGAPAQRLARLFRLFAAANQVRTENGCPIATACHGFGANAPEASKRAAGAFALMQDWIAGHLVAGGQDLADAHNQAEIWLALWQGGIALAHGLKDQALLDRITDRLISEVGPSGG